MRLEEAMVIEPPDPFEGGEFDVFEVAPRTTWTNKLGLVEPNDRLGQGVVIRVPSAADRGLDARQRQALGVADRQVLHPAVAVMHQVLACVVLAFTDRLLEGVERQVTA